MRRLSSSHSPFGTPSAMLNFAVTATGVAGGAAHALDHPAGKGRPPLEAAAVLVVCVC